MAAAKVIPPHRAAHLSGWPPGEPIRAIWVSNSSAKNWREAVLTAPAALRYISRGMRTASEASSISNGLPQPTAYRSYYAKVEFANGGLLRCPFIASRFPRAIFFGNIFFYTDPPQSGNIEVRMVPLYHPIPPALRSFWRFLVLPNAKGERTFGSPLKAPGVSPARFWRSHGHSNVRKSLPEIGGGFTVKKMVFNSGKLNIALSNAAGLNYLTSSQEPGRVYQATGKRWRVFCWGGLGNTPEAWTVIAERWPQQLVFVRGREKDGQCPDAVRCPIYGQVPTKLLAVYCKLLEGGVSYHLPSRSSKRYRRLYAAEALAGTGVPIRRLVFADATGPVVKLRHRASLEYLTNGQYFTDWGYRGKSSAHVYAAVIWLRGEELPTAAWVAVERYPRELIFTTQALGLRSGFLQSCQIRVPLIGPLPARLREAYETLLRRAPRDN